jgi:hypothetical protein
MIKIKYSKSRKAVVLDLSGVIEQANINQLAKRISRSIAQIGRGYTLIEVFRSPIFIGSEVAVKLGSLIKLCYHSGRIWRVVKVSHNDGRDPGLGILHRIRWSRDVPEMEVDNIRIAMRVAEEEMEENREWETGYCERRGAAMV